MTVVVVSRVKRDPGKVEVTLSQDGTRFTVTVDADVDQSPQALALYQIMANKMCQGQAVLAAITKPGKAL